MHEKYLVKKIKNSDHSYGRSGFRCWSFYLVLCNLHYTVDQ
nr:MAG TPA: hypothetical protein [Caudoviricetes sp.]